MVDNNSSAPLPLNDYVVLDSLEPFVENVKLVSWNFDFPLLSFKLSINHALGHSVIGFSVSHIIGKSKSLYNIIALANLTKADGHRGHQFLATLSSMYQGVHPSDPRSYPTPEPPTTQYSPDESQSGASFWNSSRCSPKEAFAKYGRDFKSMSHVRFRISPERMDKLHEIANRNNSTGQALRDQMISRQDAISAYVARLLTCKCEKSAPISLIRNNFNVSQSCDAILARHSAALTPPLYPLQPQVPSKQICPDEHARHQFPSDYSNPQALRERHRHCVDSALNPLFHYSSQISRLCQGRLSRCTSCHA